MHFHGPGNPYTGLALGEIHETALSNRSDGRWEAFSIPMNHNYTREFFTSDNAVIGMARFGIKEWLFSATMALTWLTKRDNPATQVAGYRDTCPVGREDFQGRSMFHHSDLAESEVRLT